MEDTDVVNVRRTFSPLWLFFCGMLTLLILVLSLLPAASAPSGLGWDKLNHVGGIALATGVAYLALQSRARAAGASFVYGLSLGILIELLQATFTTTRSAEWSDVGADLVGAGGVWLIITLYQRVTGSKR